jgi:dienelactone hydrolase
MKCLAKEPPQRYQSADELVADLDTIATPSDGYPSVGGVTTRRMVTFAVAIVAIAAVAWFGSRGMRDRLWVRNEAIPRIRDLIERAQIESAFALASRAATITPNDSVLGALWPAFSTTVVLHSVPEGAKVYRASFDDTSAWVYFGTTPTDSIRVPLSDGRLRVEKQGYRTISGLTGWWTYKLRPIDSPDSGMVLVPGGREIVAFLVGTQGNKRLPLGDFLMDKHEVTNREYKGFVDAGGYRNRDFWPPGTDVARYLDKTGRLGPSTWEAGDYPVGQAELPVGGVSWYEAKAYSAFVHKSLPTIYHWARAANIRQARFVVPGSNFESTAPVRGGMLRGVSEYGLFDMAGNVREWCENAVGAEDRYILGGGFSDPPYQFTEAYAQPASNRAPINGIRLVKYLNDTEPSLALAKAPQPRAFRDYPREKPASNAEYDAFRHTFDYDRTALNPRVERRDTTEDWIIERVSYDAAYGGERMFANLYLPKHGKPPYQTVVLFHGSFVLSNPVSVARRENVFGFVATAGRMLVLPILKSTFERRDSLYSRVSDNSIFWRDHVVMWVKDMRRTLDYLSTRPDVDTTKFAYIGYSWGSNMAPINLAVEPRFRAAVLYVAGLTMEGMRPEVDPFNYLLHVTQPTLMLNGRYDFFFPVEIAQRPFFQDLGTPASHRLWKVYEGGHDVPRTELIGETLKWLDKYLGPVP